ncbi:formamidopyrimidine-DNA glycosylase [Candidatus Phytoplasma oryzae]|uniref:Formamidopyrimidine-DNA glycosylase n=1 Tax=Candidatus Phytoplasma oryzae TaxID=203274 RepID=A0A139JQ11_9MOLU|nr:DNA-formamidopyrimidine glycosylase [Candidatus Phytoplasma oryzae]KXT29055.1 formamidopyrimidine-DNA glycosylase [Candidatus Phytoplasma oryzae]RAM57659.1 formamidopyrimidine-DNA glycosylase [Candidatus Phytoplasma oryzae]
MPELPEVEVTIRYLRKYLINKKIIDVNVFYEPIIKNVNLFRKICFQFFLDIKRKGKFLLFFLSGEIVLIGHLRMEGKFRIHNGVNQKIMKDDKHEHFRIFLNNNLVLRYYDFRKFGRFIVYNKKNYLIQSSLNKIAPDPFSITTEFFFNHLKKSNIAIKKILLNQRIISGIGNIYANEILFLSKIHPETRSSSLSFDQTKLIIQKAKKIFKESIKLGGSSISTFEAAGKKGSFQEKLLVYRKDKTQCCFCYNLIQKKKIDGRSSYFCLQCQKL